MPFGAGDRLSIIREAVCRNPSDDRSGAWKFIPRKRSRLMKRHTLHSLPFAPISGLMFLLASGQDALQAQTISYAGEVVGVTGIDQNAAQVALGPPDYVYTEGAFPAGASITLAFPAPLNDVAGDDLIVYAFVTGMGTESSEVRVEARAFAGDPFVDVGTILTSEGRNPQRNPFAPFDHVHHFRLDFAGRARKVTEVRLTNVAGDDFKLDAVEGIHPAMASPDHAAEIRIFRLRSDDTKRFALRIKNLSPLGSGAVITGFAIEHATDPYIDQTNRPITGERGYFEATPETTAGPDNGDVTQRTEHRWVGEGAGLAPGEVVSHERFDTIDTDVPGDEFLENFTFSLTFDDGTTLSADWTRFQEEGEAGQLFALYQYPPSPVSISEARPAFFLDVASAAIVAEAPCTNCGSSENGNENGNVGSSNENGHQTGNDNSPSMPPMRGCPGPGMIYFVVIFGALASYRQGYRRRDLQE